VPEHYSPEDVAHFLAGRLSRRRSQEFVRHLLHGCGTCSSLLATHGGWAPAEMPLASYDAVISRAKANATPAVATPQNATPAVATPQDAVVILTSLLLGERSWETLSASDIATLRAFPKFGRSSRRVAHYGATMFMQRSGLPGWPVLQLTAWIRRSSGQSRSPIYVVLPGLSWRTPTASATTSLAPARR